MFGFQGSPSLSLVDPLGHRLTPGVDANLYFTTVVTATYAVVQSPLAGDWVAEVGNLAGEEYYVLNVLGSNLPPTVTVGVTPVEANSVQIDWSVTDPDDTPTVALYYDIDRQGADGTLIAEGLVPPVAGFTWDTAEVKSGAYYVYARADDLRNSPVVVYAPDSVQVENTQPPSAPTNLRVQLDPPWTSARLCWDLNPEQDVVGYKVYFGSLPGVYDLALLDVGNVHCAWLAIPPWLQQGYVTVLAYDNSGNESPLAVESQIIIDRRTRLYFPLLRRD